MSQSEFDSALPNGIGLAPYLRMKQEGMTENEKPHRGVVTQTR